VCFHELVETIEISLRSSSYSLRNKLENYFDLFIYISRGQFHHPKMILISLRQCLGHFISDIIFRYKLYVYIVFHHDDFNSDQASVKKKRSFEFSRTEILLSGAVIDCTFPHERPLTARRSFVRSCKAYVINAMLKFQFRPYRRQVIVANNRR